jgi:O-antigen ligase
VKNFACTFPKTLPLTFLSIAVFSLPFSLTICHIAFILFITATIVQGRSLFKGPSLRDYPVVLLILLLLVSLGGMFYTDNPESGWADLEKKLFFFLVPITVSFFLKLNKEEVVIVLSVFIFSCLAASLVCIFSSVYQMKLLMDGAISLADFNYLGSTLYHQLNPTSSDYWMLFSYRALSSGVAMHPTYLSLYIAFCVAIIIHFLDIGQIRTSKNKTLAITLVAYFIVFIIFLSSRIIIAGLFALIVLTIFQHKAVQSVGVKTLFAFGVIAAITFLIYLNPISRYRCYQEFLISSFQIQPNHLYTNSTEIRASLWWIGLKSVQNVNWIWGSGTGESQNVMKQTGETYRIKNILGSDNPHNQFLCTVLQHGLIGALVLAALLIVPMISAASKNEYLIFSFCALITLCCLTETFLERQRGIDFFAVFYPLLLFQSKSGRSIKKENP